MKLGVQAVSSDQRPLISHPPRSVIDEKLKKVSVPWARYNLTGKVRLTSYIE